MLSAVVCRCTMRPMLVGRQLSKIGANFLSSGDIDRYDVVISGGGIVGAAMAASLGNDALFTGKRVLLIEAGPDQKLKVLPETYASRTCALNPGTVDLLDSFGAWGRICEKRKTDVKRMQVWDACSDAMITFNQEDLTENLAYIVENSVIVSSIYEQLDNFTDVVDIRYNTKALSYSINEELPYAVIKLTDGSEIQTKLIIGADGIKSHLREAMGIHTVGWNYDQMGVVATLKIAEEVENTSAWQRFLPTGPIAMLPLSANNACLIWTTTTEDAKYLLNLPDESFVDAVNDGFWSENKKDAMAEYATRVFDGVLQTAGLEGSASQQLPPTVLGIEEKTRGAFPLGLLHSTHYVKHRVALIGDAAHRVHPLAGQGVNLGFGDVSSLSEKLSTALYNGFDLGSINHLLNYESDRQRHVVPTIAAVDGLNRIYSTSSTPLVLLRSLGCQATNSLSQLKNMMMSHAAS